MEELMKRHVWIDAAHSNELQIQTIIEKHDKGIESSGPLPLLVTHTQLRDFYPVERGLGSLEINYIKKNDGIVGIIPSQKMMSNALKQASIDAMKSNPEEANATSAGHGLTCISGLDIFKKTVAYAIATLGSPERVTLSSDINAPLDGLSPGCGEAVSQNENALNTDQFDLHRRGYYTYSQWNTLTKFVDPNGWADQSLEHFLFLWEKIRKSSSKSLP